MYSAKFVWLAFGAGIVIGIGLGRNDEAIEAFAAFVAAGMVLTLAVTALDRVVEWRRWRRFRKD